MVMKMNEKLEEIINSQKEILSTLPANNRKQKNKFIIQTNEYKEESLALLEKINKEINERFNKYNTYTVNTKIEEIDNYLKIFTNNFYLLASNNTTFEKSGLDRITYNISKYYRGNLDEVNESILKAINIFKQASIILTPNDFAYSRFTTMYMTEFFKHLEDLTNNELKDKFNEIYWQCSDIITHIELNIKYLYLKNQKKFDEFYKKCAIKFVNGNTYDEVYLRYNELVRTRDYLKQKDVYLILQKFQNREYVANDFKKEKLDAFYLEQDNELLNRFRESILEYRSYLKVSYIIEEFKKLYAEKDKYKNLSKTVFNEIKKNEGKLFGINKKEVALSKKGKDIANLDVEVDKQITVLKEKYDLLTDALFKERILAFISESSTYKDILDFMYNNYVPFVNMIKSSDEEIEYNDIMAKIEEVHTILLNPYLSFLNNVCINDTKDIKIIVSDLYSLSNFDVKPETFENEGDLDNILSTIDKVVTYHNLETANVLVDNIKFICDVTDLNNKAQN